MTHNHKTLPVCHAEWNRFRAQFKLNDIIRWSLKSDNIDFRFSINGCDREFEFHASIEMSVNMFSLGLFKLKNIDTHTHIHCHQNSKYSVKRLSCQTDWHCSMVSGRKHIHQFQYQSFQNSAIWIASDFGNEIYESWNMQIWFVAVVPFFQWKYFNCHFSCKNIRLRLNSILSMWDLWTAHD